MNRISCALMGAVLAAVGFSVSAEARPEATDAYTVREYSPVSRSTKPQAWKSGTNKKQVRAKTGKRYTSGKAGKAGKRTASSRTGKRQAAYRAGKRTRTAGYSGGGASRGCLTGAARGLLSRIESNFGPVQVISTCRPGAVIAGSGKPSRHRHGNAIDFSAGARKGAIVSWLIANHHSGGTMTYRGMNHIHVDIGPRFVKLGSGSRSG